jgi:cytochrome c peroxidase
MRFKTEGGHGANAGLLVARDHLEKIKQKFPGISYGDLWTLAGVVAVQEMGGPKVPWRPGRIDGYEADSTPDGRLPDAALGQDHIRSIFYRMGLDDQEIVALLGAHALGRCHEDRSGYSGPWTPSPTVFTNDFYNQLMTKKWVEKKWKGPKQYEDKETRELMMLPSDIALLKDKNFRKYVELYAKDNAKFFEDFAKVYKKLLELGVKFPEDTKDYLFPTLNA